MADSNKTAEIHYYIQKKQLSAANGITTLQQINKSTSHSDPLIPNDQVSTTVISPNHKIREPEILHSILTDQIQRESVTMEEIRDQRPELEAVEASEKQLYHKAHSSTNRTVSHKRFLAN